MTNPSLSKRKIMEAVIKELPVATRNDIGDDVDGIMTRWWTTGRQDGLRLTEYGDFNFRMAEVEFYDFNLEKDIKTHPAQSWHMFLLECNKKIKCPYYLGVNKVNNKNTPYIRFYDSKVAMMVQLYGSLREYLNSTKDKR